jgi:rhodanese-related sulfurtransferase
LIQQITPTEFLRRRDAGELWQLLDVREVWEVSMAAVEDSLCIPMGEIPGRLDELDESMPIAVMCHSGVRSAQVVAFLNQRGFKLVANLRGGINAWSTEVDETVPRY